MHTRVHTRSVSLRPFMYSGIGERVELRDRCPLRNFLHDRTRSYRSLAFERLTRSFPVSRALGRRKRLSREGAEFESNLQMEGRVKVNKIAS